MRCVQIGLWFLVLSLQYTEGTRGMCSVGSSHVQAGTLILDGENGVPDKSLILYGLVEYDYKICCCRD